MQTQELVHGYSSHGRYLGVVNAYLLGEATEELIKKLGEDEAHILGKERHRERERERVKNGSIFAADPREKKKNATHYEAWTHRLKIALRLHSAIFLLKSSHNRTWTKC